MAPRPFRIIVPPALVDSAPRRSALAYGPPLDCSTVCRAVGRLATADEERAAKASWVVVSFHAAPADAADQFYGADIMPAPVESFRVSRGARRVVANPIGRLLVMLDGPGIELVDQSGAALA
jgi:hypothetical protein